MKFTITATNKKTGKRQDVSACVTKNEALAYIKEEKRLFKKSPKGGLFGDFKNPRLRKCR